MEHSHLKAWNSADLFAFLIKSVFCFTNRVHLDFNTLNCHVCSELGGNLKTDCILGGDVVHPMWILGGFSYF